MPPGLGLPSGKTTVMQRLGLWAEENEKQSYFVNLDPAVKETFFEANIDIRDNVNYKEVMKQYNLGPNGAITTSLNLFATKFDQVLDILKRRAKSSALDYIFIDTPGQIEVFTWSASGQIISESLAATFPTIMLFCIDTPRCSSPTTFMSNMLYACSVLYRSQLPLVCIFNKSDILPADSIIEWMKDYEAFQDAVDADPVGESGYLGSLNRSLCLVIDEFYKTLPAVPVSAASGLGFDRLEQAFIEARGAYVDDYLPILRERIAASTRREQARQEAELGRLQEDMKEDANGGEREAEGR